jgi:hypothetical protein
VLATFGFAARQFMGSIDASSQHIIFANYSKAESKLKSKHNGIKFTN